MHAQLLHLNKEISSKSTLLDKVNSKKSKPGGPGVKPPTQAPVDDPGYGAHNLSMKDELTAKDQIIEQLNDKIIVLEAKLEDMQEKPANVQKLLDDID